jgi:hypothetical protein
MREGRQLDPGADARALHHDARPVRARGDQAPDVARRANQVRGCGIGQGANSARSLPLEKDAPAPLSRISTIDGSDTAT